MKPLRKLLRAEVITPVIIWALFVSAAHSWISKTIRYSGIEDWPHVLATDVKERGEAFSAPMTSATGEPFSANVDYKSVEFAYEVDGIVFTGDRASPDGGGASGAGMKDGEWRAYYNPNDPGTAVLNPARYEGTGAVVLAAFSGVLCAFHLVFTIRV